MRHFKTHALASVATFFPTRCVTDTEGHDHGTTSRSRRRYARLPDGDSRSSTDSARRWTGVTSWRHHRIDWRHARRSRRRYVPVRWSSRRCRSRKFHHIDCGNARRSNGRHDSTRRVDSLGVANRSDWLKVLRIAWRLPWGILDGWSSCTWRDQLRSIRRVQPG